MPGSWPPSELPRLTPDNHTVTSKVSTRYNCIAWAAGDTARWWWPDARNIGYWPPGVQRALTLEAFVEAYGTLGFRPCENGCFQTGVEKVAILGRLPANAPPTPEHAALQLDSGEWTSKLGPFEDISHATLEAVGGPAYGEVICYLSRPRPGASELKTPLSSEST